MRALESRVDFKLLEITLMLDGGGMKKTLLTDDSVVVDTSRWAYCTNKLNNNNKQQTKTF